MNPDATTLLTDSNSWMWGGKLAPPSSNTEILQRTALLDRLDAEGGSPLLLISAPPGFGKTSLLAQWRERLLQATPPVPVAWLTLDEADGEPHRFLAYLVVALKRAGVPLAQLAELAHEQTLDAEPRHTLSLLVAALARHLSPAGTRIVLVLDDYHRAGSPDVDEIVGLLIERASQWLQLVLACRSRPQLQLASLQARGLVYELPAADLALQRSETASLMRSDAELAELVHQRTEGWPVAVQLARLWLRRGGHAANLQEFSGRVDAVAQYLTEQVFRALPEASREFLLETSLLERFDAALADEVRGRSDSAALLEQLRGDSTLLVSLDTQGRWVRYNHLLADFLQSRLSPVRAVQIHRAAACWLGAQGDWLLAVRHALRAGDRAQAVKLLRQAGSWELVLRKGIAYTRSLINEFDELERRSEPTLLLIQAYLHAKLGNEPLAIELLRLAQVGLGEQGQGEYRVIETLVHGYFDKFADDATFERGLALPNLSPLARACLLSERAAAALSAGRLGDASEAAKAALVQMQVAHSPLGEAYVLLHDAQAQAWAGHVFFGRSRIDAALQIAEQHFGTESSLRSLVGCFKAQHLYWAGQWNEANEWAQAADLTLAGTDAWTEVLMPHAEISARTLLRIDGLQAALNRLEAVAAQARARYLPRLSQLVRAWRVDLLAQCGLCAQAEQEALAADLSAVRDNWRELEAARLALARLRAAKGAPEQAAADLRQLAESFAQRGLLLCAWRFEAQAWAYRRRDLDHPQAIQDFRHWMQKVWAQSLAGLLLEAGHGVLPWISRLDPSGQYLAWPGLAALVVKLRGWQAHPPRPRGQLSSKETMVLTLVASGHSNKEVARATDVTENTVKFHLKQIFQKLGVDNRAAAITAGIQQGLIRSFE